MKITVVGLGRVGAVAAAGLALAGHDVLAVDINLERVGALKGGQSRSYEPGLGRWVSSALQMGALRFLHRDEVREDLGDIALVAVGTPPAQGSAADLQQVRAAVSWIKSMYPEDLVIAMKSTVPPGSGLRIIEQELAGTGIRYVANPEFLREGQAVGDWESPDRIVIGAASNDVESVEVMTRMYAGIDAPIMATDITSAEMIKYASNAFLATRISFINEIAALCDSLGASIDDVSEGLAMDSRTGSQNPGRGWLRRLLLPEGCRNARATGPGERRQRQFAAVGDQHQQPAAAGAAAGVTPTVPRRHGRAEGWRPGTGVQTRYRRRP